MCRPGFPRSGDAYGTFVGPITKRAARQLHRDVRDYLLLISNVHTSLWQASEWGMRGLQGTFSLDARKTRFHPVWISYPQTFDIFLRENSIVSVVL